jgi:phosphoserine phosphatase
MAMHEHLTVGFDCDSTLTTIEGIDFLAEETGAGKRVEEITRQAMNGEMGFRDALRMRLRAVQPTLPQVEKLGRTYREHVFPGAEELIRKLQRQWRAKILIISGGFSQAIEPLARSLGIPAENVSAIPLYFYTDGSYKGFNDSHPLAHNDGKARVLRAEKQRNPDRRIVMTGDGTTDLAAWEDGAADHFIGFGGVHARPAVKAKAPVFFEGKNMNELLEMILGAVHKTTEFSF